MYEHGESSILQRCLSYADKFKSSNNLDEILLASTNYINEDLNHTRKDNIKEFARGEVLIRVGANDYSAKVIVGFTAGKQMLLYDIVDFAPTNIATKKRTHQDFGESRTPRKDVFSNITVTQKSPSVNSILSENPKKITTESKNTAENSGVKRQNSIENKAKNTEEYLKQLRAIGKKSVNNFTSEDIRQAEQFAQRYYKEMGVKSPFFRAWFGDWRAYDKTPITVAIEQGDARGTKINNDTGWGIQVSGKIFNETKSHNREQNIYAQAYLPYINSIVENAVLFDSSIIPSEKAKSINSAFMHTFFALADSGNGPEILKLYVEELNDANSDGTIKRAYQLQNIEKQQLSVKGSGNTPLASSASAADIHTVADLFEVVKRKNKGFQPKPVNSLLLNADGTPKVFYHGAKKNGGFTVFKDWQYFTDKKSYAERYAERENDKALYEVFITANKIFDTRNADARKIHEQIRQEYGLSELTKNGLPDWTDGYDITDYLNEHPELGYDAIILNEGGDLVNGEPVSRGTSIVIKDSTQIKSATDNIGTFDGTNPDIRFQRKLPDVQEKLKKMSGSDDIDDVKRMAYGLADDFMKYAKAARLEMTETRGLMPQPTRVSEIVAKYNDYRKTGISNKQLESDITDIFTDYMNGVGSSGTLFNYITDTIMKRELNSYEVIGDETFKAVRAYTDGGRFKVSDATVGSLVDTFGSLGEINGILRENYGFTIAKETDTRAETRAVWAPVGAQLAEEAGHVFDGTDYSYTSKYTTENSYVTSRKVYQCESCEGCPYRNECHTSKYDRRNRVSHKLTEQNQKAMDLITTDEGILLRMNRSIQVGCRR